MKKTQRKQFPTFSTDEEAEHFVATADLSEFDFSKFRTVRFEFQKKESRVTMRMPNSLLTAVKTRAAERSIPYQRLIRELIEAGIAPNRATK